jgi:thioredoxin 1
MRSIVCYVLIGGIAFGWCGFAQTKNPTRLGTPNKRSGETGKPLITFIELGSVNCIPCKLMQPVMRSIETKYGTQVQVVFHDVWTDEGRPYSGMYKIRVIPTQVFLDASGREFHRHEGFYPEPEIDSLLARRGLKVLSTGR